jgi:hypothetical protein
LAAIALLGAFACQDVDTRELGCTADDTLDLTVFTDNAGTITFGGGSAPPPPNDPDVGYPTNVDYIDLLSPPEECSNDISTPVGTADCDKVALCDNNHCTCADGYCEGGAVGGVDQSASPRRHTGR